MDEWRAAVEALLGPSIDVSAEDELLARLVEMAWRDLRGLRHQIDIWPMVFDGRRVAALAGPRLSDAWDRLNRSGYGIAWHQIAPQIQVIELWGFPGS